MNEDDEEVYQAWKTDFIRFDPLGRGPLIVDHKTGLVYDVNEFWMRQNMICPKWQLGYEYRKGESCQHGGPGFGNHRFQCTMPHIAGKFTEPEAGADWSNVWVELVDGGNMYPGKEGRLEILGIEPVEIELRTTDNKTIRRTTDRKVAHEAVDRFFDFHEGEFNATH